jgi:hypothetical protein
MDQLFTLVEADRLPREVSMNVYAHEMLKGEIDRAFPFTSFHL